MDEVREFQYRAPRFQVDFRFLLRTEIGSRVLHARCFEISEGGLAGWVSESLLLHTKVTLLLTLTGQQTPIAIPAVVTRSAGTEHAFSFIFPTTKERDHLHQYFLSM